MTLLYRVLLSLLPFLFLNGAELDAGGDGIVRYALGSHPEVHQRSGISAPPGNAPGRESRQYPGDLRLVTTGAPLDTITEAVIDTAHARIIVVDGASSFSSAMVLFDLSTGRETLRISLTNARRTLMRANDGSAQWSTPSDYMPGHLRGIVPTAGFDTLSILTDYIRRSHSDPLFFDERHRGRNDSYAGRPAIEQVVIHFVDGRPVGATTLLGTTGYISSPLSAMHGMLLGCLMMGSSSSAPTRSDSGRWFCRLGIGRMEAAPFCTGARISAAYGSRPLAPRLRGLVCATGDSAWCYVDVANRLFFTGKLRGAKVPLLTRIQPRKTLGAAFAQAAGQLHTQNMAGLRAPVVTSVASDGKEIDIILHARPDAAAPFVLQRYRLDGRFLGELPLEERGLSSVVIAGYTGEARLIVGRDVAGLFMRTVGS